MSLDVHRNNLDRPERRAALLVAALNEFAETGFRDSRIEDIAAAAGLSKGAVYLHFASKGDLYRAAVQFAIESHDDPDRQADVLPKLNRLMIRDGAQCPNLAKLYYSYVLAPRLDAIRAHASSMPLPSAKLLDRSPQLTLIPEIFVLIWNDLFGRVAPLDERAFVETYREVIQVGLMEPRRAQYRTGAPHGQ